VKDELCKAFCAKLEFRTVPAGLAVGTAFKLTTGEPVGFFIVGPDERGLYRLEDDGTTMSFLESAGADQESETRADAFTALFEEYAAKYSMETGEIATGPLSREQIPEAALKFVALLMRLQDMLLLVPERAASTFREDALRDIRQSFGNRAVIRENESISGLDFPADAILEAQGRTPVAIYLAQSEQRVLEAIVAQMAALYETHSGCSVIALLEKETSINRRMLKQATNRLTAVPIYEGDERAAISRIEREVFGPQRNMH
jgi:hypothetical protein